MFIQYKHQISFLILLILTIFYFRIDYYFFGFEYEDCFVYTATAIDSNLLSSTKHFRTYPVIDNQFGDSHEFFSSHFVTYAYFLRAIADIFYLKEIPLIHVYANCILICLNVLVFKKLKIDTIIISVYAFSFLTIYTGFSAVSENLSFTLICFFLYLIKKDLNESLITFILILCILTKRENLVLLIPYSFYVYQNFKSLNIYFYIFLFIATIFLTYINPFSTEFIETTNIGVSTFNSEHIKKQFTQFFISFLNPLNALCVPIIIYFTQKKKYSIDKVIFITGIVLFSMYNMHYRSPLIVSNEIEMNSLFTWRYLYNIMPFFIIPNSEIEVKNKFIGYTFVIFILVINIFNIKPLILEEDFELRQFKNKQVKTHSYPLKLKLAGCDIYGYPIEIDAQINSQ